MQNAEWTRQLNREIDERNQKIESLQYELMEARRRIEALEESTAKHATNVVLSSTQI